MYIQVALGCNISGLPKEIRDILNDRDDFPRKRICNAKDEHNIQTILDKMSIPFTVGMRVPSGTIVKRIYGSTIYYEVRGTGSAVIVEEVDTNHPWTIDIDISDDFGNDDFREYLKYLDYKVIHEDLNYCIPCNM